jgi:ankyrin repeat protein
MLTHVNPAMTLLILPNELLLSIAETLESQPNINALAKTNRRCYNLLNSFLYAYNARHYNSSALHWAATHGQPATAQESLRQGADVESKDQATDSRPLIQASRSGHADIVSLLVAHGANLHAKNTRTSKDAITIAVTRNKTAVVRILLDHGVDPDSEDSRGFKLLHLAAQEYPSSREALARVLVEKGADLESVSQCFESPLQVACSANSVDVASCLIRFGADFDRRSREGKTLLHLAASKGHVEFIELLLERGVDLESRDDEGYTPLHLACFNGQMQVARLLLDTGADLEARSLKGNTPLLMGVLWESTVYMANDSDPVQMSSFLLERGARPDPGNDCGITPLHVAMAKGDASLCKILLQHGVDPEPRTKAGITPLHKIALGGSLDSARHLLQRGADVQPKDDAGDTPLHLAAQKYYPAFVRLLLEAGADRLVKNNKGQLPFHLAVEGMVGQSREKQARHEEVLDLLEAKSDC